MLNRKLLTGKTSFYRLKIVHIFYSIQNVYVSLLLFFFCYCSVLGSTLFSLGSVLVWAIIRSSIPHNNVLGTVVGLGSGYALARASYEYLKHIDAIAEEKSNA